ncbi:MAG: glycosyltransferase family 2 protein [Solirubrobacteraceae bacterium]
MTPSASIIVINKDDPGLRDTLAALDQLHEVRSGAAEVIVVDASQGRLDHLRGQFPRIRWEAFIPLAGRSSIPHQRNVGVSLAEGETIVFIDASCVPDPGWLTELVRPIAGEGEVAVAGAHRSTDGGHLRDDAIDRRGAARYLDEAPTINLAVSRSVLAELGGFDETFRYGSDVDLTWRLIDSGRRLRYAPESSVVHAWGDLRADMRRSFAYGRARAHLHLKHPGRWRRLLGPDLPALVYPPLILALPALLRRPRRLAVLAVPLLRNRGQHPVATLIDHLIYGAGILRGVADHVGRAGS